MDREFFEPQQAAELLHCSEAWLRAGAANCKFPHLAWGKGKIVFTDKHLEEIVDLREIRAHSTAQDITRRIGTRATGRPH
ncbi:hypothetical protein [Arthrobacter wenxiniae]|uniref:Helix-turn-helix domain-containing protein n=1 Tax=Arthrobacter wenxiniae TaxID=2713570 RepID=A0A7Y7LYP1_9MICC|nr:hypothetical protein [Arthrobacter wenxiniae]NVM95152.1 hypothetical protein [Arthrobacter wenxiniae]